MLELSVMHIFDIPIQVYQVIYHVLVRYGRTLEQNVQDVALAKGTPPDEISRELEELYDKIRGIIIHDSTSVSE
jgi:hypothetical protein